MTTEAKPKKLSVKKQNNLDELLVDAAGQGQTHDVQTLLTAGANIHALNDRALRWAAYHGCTETVQALLAAGANVHANDDAALYEAVKHDHAETVKALLAVGANVHADNDLALCAAANLGHTKTVRVMANHIFAPEYWHGKTRAEVEAEARALYGKIEGENVLNPINPERLCKAASILADCAITCWQQVRPPPPKLTISPLPAQPRPL
jgi:hypothetical protein